MKNFLRKEVNPELTKLFTDNGFDVTWDYDSRYEWIEVYDDSKMILQIESSVTVEQFINLLLDDHIARQKGVFIDPNFFIAGTIFESDDEMLKFSKKFELFRNSLYGRFNKTANEIHDNNSIKADYINLIK